MSRSPVILGLNSVYHESSACLVRGADLLAFAEEDRFNRIKHAKTAKIDNADELPRNAIDYCLATASLGWRDIDFVAMSFDPDRRSAPGPEPTVVGGWGDPDGEREFIRRVRSIPARLSQYAGVDLTTKCMWVPHEYAHAASAFYPSSYREAAVLSLDGIGEYSTGLLAHGSSSGIEELGCLYYPNSIGMIWEKISKFIGLNEYDAAKVMGLAAFASPEKFVPDMKQLFFDGSKSMDVDIDILRFRVEDYAPLEELFGPRRQRGERIDTRDAQLAAALQQVTEEALLSFCTELADRTGSENLCLAGGVALNCVANGRLAREGQFRSIFVQPMAHDAGTALGAALQINQAESGGRFEMVSPYLGPGYSEAEMESELARSGLPWSRLPDAPAAVARLIAAGQIGGWFQGRAEVGPRALGNRSILADPRRPGSKELINLRVKHREYFRPFAPSVLAEAAHDWFEIFGESRSFEFMSFAFAVRRDKYPLVPAVLHVDGTSRLQIVRQATNPRYHRLISEFEKLTGVPLLLNTSFNTSDEPIVLSPGDAIRTFQNTGLDFLVLGDFLVSRPLTAEWSI
jgi:carbamoyltransferase